jgi:hypothetical protein
MQREDARAKGLCLRRRGAHHEADYHEEGHSTGCEAPGLRTILPLMGSSFA